MRTITIKLNLKEAESVLKSISMRNRRKMVPEERIYLEGVVKEIKEQGDKIGWEKLFLHPFWDKPKELKEDK